MIIEETGKKEMSFNEYQRKAATVLKKIIENDFSELKMENVDYIKAVFKKYDIQPHELNDAVTVLLNGVPNKEENNITLSANEMRTSNMRNSLDEIE